MSGTISEKMYSGLNSQINTQDSDIGKMMAKGSGKDGEFSEMDMVKLNMAVSRRSTVMNLFSSAIKNMTDTEKQVASKM